MTVTNSSEGESVNCLFSCWHMMADCSQSESVYSLLSLWTHPAWCKSLFSLFRILKSVRETCADWYRGSEPQNDPAMHGKKDPEGGFPIKLPRRNADPSSTQVSAPCGPVALTKLVCFCFDSYLFLSHLVLFWSLFVFISFVSFLFFICFYRVCFFFVLYLFLSRLFVFCSLFVFSLLFVFCSLFVFISFVCFLFIIWFYVICLFFVLYWFLSHPQECLDPSQKDEKKEKNNKGEKLPEFGCNVPLWNGMKD